VAAYKSDKMQYKFTANSGTSYTSLCSLDRKNEKEAVFDSVYQLITYIQHKVSHIKKIKKREAGGGGGGGGGRGGHL
jgi:hypothetical protein